jgi:hypothetical protein
MEFRDIHSIEELLKIAEDKNSPGVVKLLRMVRHGNDFLIGPYEYLHKRSPEQIENTKIYAAPIQWFLHVLQDSDWRSQRSDENLIDVYELEVPINYVTEENVAVSGGAFTASPSEITKVTLILENVSATEAYEWLSNNENLFTPDNDLRELLYYNQNVGLTLEERKNNYLEVLKARKEQYNLEKNPEFSEYFTDLGMDTQAQDKERGFEKIQEKYSYFFGIKSIEELLKIAIMQRKPCAMCGVVQPTTELHSGEICHNCWDRKRKQQQVQTTPAEGDDW